MILLILSLVNWLRRDILSTFTLLNSRFSKMLISWDTLEADIEACIRCQIAHAITRKVPGQGNRDWPGS